MATPFNCYSFSNGIIIASGNILWDHNVLFWFFVFLDNCIVCKNKRTVSEKICVFIASNFCNFLRKIYCGFLKIDLGELWDQNDIKFALHEKLVFQVYLPLTICKNDTGWRRRVCFLIFCLSISLYACLAIFITFLMCVTFLLVFLFVFV